MAVSIGTDTARLVKSAAQPDCRIATARTRRAAIVAAVRIRRARNAIAVRSADGARRAADLSAVGADADTRRRAADAELQTRVGKTRNAWWAARRRHAAADRARAAGLFEPAADFVAAAVLVGGTIADEERGACAARHQPAEHAGAEEGTDNPQHLAT